MTTNRLTRLGAVLRQRCPRCRRGPVFYQGLTMHPECPVCGYRYAREPGYYLGAMYVSFALLGPLLLALTVVVHLAVLPGWPLHWALVPALALLAPLVPVVFRYARVIWFHFEQWIDPVP